MNERKKINRKICLRALAFVPLAIPFTAMILGMIDQTFFWGYEESYLSFVSEFTFLGLTFGVIFWLPSILGCWAIEAIAYNNEATRTNIIWAYAIEAVLASMAIITIFNGWEHFDWFFFSVPIGISLTQFLRFWFLSYKGRMYRDSPMVTNDEVLDSIDLEIE